MPADNEPQPKHFLPEESPSCQTECVTFWRIKRNLEPGKIIPVPTQCLLFDEPDPLDRIETRIDGVHHVDRRTAPDNFSRGASTWREGWQRTGPRPRAIGDHDTAPQRVAWPFVTLHDLPLWADILLQDNQSIWPHVFDDGRVMVEPAREFPLLQFDKFELQDIARKHRLALVHFATPRINARSFCTDIFQRHSCQLRALTTSHLFVEIRSAEFDDFLIECWDVGRERECLRGNRVFLGPTRLRGLGRPNADFEFGRAAT